MRNYVELIGRLGSDPKLQTISSGDQYSYCTLATSETYKDKEGNKKEKTEWHNIVAWRGTAKGLALCKKGKLIMVIGKIKTRKYTDKDGAEKTITEINVDELLFLERMSERTDQNQNQGQQRTGGDRSNMSMM